MARAAQRVIATCPGIPWEQLCLVTRYGQGYIFRLEDICLLQAIGSRFVKLTELLPCVKAKCVSETDFKTGREILGQSPLQSRSYSA